MTKPKPTIEKLYCYVCHLDTDFEVARDSAHVVARESAHVVARGSAHVEAKGPLAVAIRRSPNAKVIGLLVVEAFEQSTDPKAWLKAVGAKVSRGKAILYKRTGP